MATVTLSTAFDTENLWATRLAGASLKTPTIYEFQSAPGFFVRVTGTNFTYGVGEVITDGLYTSIDVYQNANFTGLLATYSSAIGTSLVFFFTNGSTDALPASDTINGSGGNDTITGRGGGDSLDGKNGSDIYVFNTVDIDSGLQLNDTGGSGVDTIRLAAGISFDFTAQSIAGIEALTFTGAQSATFNANQLLGNGGSAALAVTGVDGSAQTLTIQTATNFSAALWTFTSWEATDLIKINGTANADTITGSTLSDIIAGGGGADTLDGGNGSDHYTLAESHVVPGLTISDTGASGVDTLDFGNGAFVFTGCTLSGVENLSFSGPGSGGGDFRGGTVSGIEKVSFISGGNFGAGFNADQVSTNLVLEANGSPVTFVIDNATQFSAAGWTLIGWANSYIEIDGTTGNDTLTGSSGDDIINGKLGADVLNGGAGNDLIGGGIGSDTVRGGAGKDDLTGGSEGRYFCL